ncbi:hypothetical protein ONZ51_g3960 [Trametes cubensis]|uniref:DUF6533 domain-containing protein n=1 Tax=Trametes cubensis TaxID=1111947 RepID=A0AAD7TWZ3_9APHY|nr:hypothetical protein ONZ51_g3960 [Trametes cubensis]
MSDLAKLLENAASHLGLLMLVKYASVGSLTLVVRAVLYAAVSARQANFEQILDIVETFSDEVILMWPSKLTLMKTVYFANRYMPVVDIALGVANDTQFTQLLIGVRWVMDHVTNTIPIGISIIRSDPRSADGGPLELQQDSAGLLDILDSPDHHPPQEVLDITGCVASISDGISIWFYASILLSETTVVLLTAIKRYSMKMRDQTLPLLFHTMYRDGAGFYAILLSVSIGNMLCMTLAPVEASSMLQLFHHAVHSTLTSRVLLNLRAAAARSSGLSMNDFHRTTHIAFEVPVIHSTQPNIAVSDIESGSSYLAR